MPNHAEIFDDSDFYAPAAPGNGARPPAMPQAAPAAANSLTAVEQSRAVAEVQAALVIAKSQPRDELRAEYKIREACKRVSLAETAIYSYKRGDGQVEGPSIRLAETIARYWGNLNYGFREIGREGVFSEVEAYAWDLETNTKAVRQFQVKHWRDTRKGSYEVKEERDKYELIANYAQRRVRACILEIVPGDIVEAAMEQCNLTLHGHSDLPLKDRVKNMVRGFEALGVTQTMITAKIQHSLDSLTIHEFRQLAKFYTAIKDGYSTAEEIFGPDPLKTPAQTAETPKKADAAPAEPSPPAPSQEAKGKDKPAAKSGRAPTSKQEPAALIEENYDDDEVASLEQINALKVELSRLGIANNTLPNGFSIHGLTRARAEKALAELKSMPV